MAEQRFCKAKVGGSTPLLGSNCMANKSVIGVGLICGAIGILVGWGATHFFIDRTSSGDIFYGESRASGYKLINPLLECQTGEGEQPKELSIFKQAIVEEVARRKNERIKHISVYFRDLNNGPWFGVDEQEKFIPASLLKVPIMLAAYKEQEKDPGFFGKKVRYAGESSGDNQNIVSGDELKVGEIYTTRELMRRMIQNSDNRALTTLSGTLPDAAFSRVMEDFGIPLPTSTISDFIGVHRYAGFFRILFNASYLSRAASEDALEILSESKFKDGLVAGVPKDITVAHKFGERTLVTDTQALLGRQLHDCGIVYYPGRPYLLCVMTRGTDYTEMADVIRDISDLTYREVDRQMRDKD